ncbi:MAG: class I SAM-dependent methyltransferase [Beijerinckiaceae bacterium]
MNHPVKNGDDRIGQAFARNGGLITRRGALAGAAALFAAAPALAQEPAKDVPPLQAANPDWLYVPTPHDVVDKMLELGQVTKDDIVLDLGCGDGRIPIAAAKKFGCRARGVDINPVRIKEANANLKGSGVENLVTFVEGDVFEVPIADATVVTLYLFPHVMLKLRDRLRAELKPGTRVVSHEFMMGDWEPKTSERIRNARVHLWVI